MTLIITRDDGGLTDVVVVHFRVRFSGFEKKFASWYLGFFGSILLIIVTNLSNTNKF